MRILITGGSGFVGRALCNYLKKHTLFIYTHQTSFSNHLNFCEDITILKKDSEFPMVDAIVNLAGESIAKKRLSKNRLNELLQSRLDTIALLKEKYKDNFPRIFMQASATGIYNNSEKEIDETGSLANNLYQKLCSALEENTLNLLKDTLSTIYLLRLGVVVGLGGGLCKNLKFLPNTRFYKGQNYVPYIKIEDTVKAIAFLLTLKVPTAQVQIVNLSSPKYLTLNELISFCKGNSPIKVPCLKFVLSLDKRGQLLLVDHKIKPNYLLSKGFIFSK